MKRLWVILFMLGLIYNSGCQDDSDSKNNFSIIGNWEVSHLWRNNSWQGYGEQQYNFRGNGEHTSWVNGRQTSGSHRFEDMILYIGSSIYVVDNDGDNIMTWTRQSTNKRCCKFERM